MRETNPASAPEDSLSQVGAVHPNQLLLLADVVTHEGVCALVTSFSRKVKQGAFAKEDHAERSDTMLEGF